MSKEIDNLHLVSIAKRTETNDKRKKLIHRVRASIRKLDADLFYRFIIEVLHINHYKWLLEYNNIINQLLFLEDHTSVIDKNKKSYKNEVQRLKYLLGTYRMTLTFHATSFTPDGYTPEILEWLIINKVYDYNYELPVEEKN